jgi:hypothetical protein
MKNPALSDPLFRQAVEAIDSGNLKALREMVEASPRLVQEPVNFPEEGYFQNPYLICFVADNPIRHPSLPGNIVEVTRMLIDCVHRFAPDTYDRQINYTLGLVATGRIPKECGVQLELIDLLIDAGARGGASATGIPGDCQGFHSHATALHQAVSSGSLESVKLLVEADADLDVRDRVYDGTPLGWADYLQREEGIPEEMKQKCREIEAYLRSVG